MNIMGNNVILAVEFLLNETRFFKRFRKKRRTAVHYRNFRTVNFNQNIINFHSHQCRQQMLDRTHTRTVLRNGGTPRRIAYIINICINNRASVQINTLKFKTVIIGGRFEMKGSWFSGMQSHTGYTDLILDCSLFYVHSFKLLAKGPLRLKLLFIY